MIYGSLNDVDVIDADKTKGAFLSPIVIIERNPFASESVHLIEAFGPVSTLMPYNTIDEAIELAKKGKGSLVCSIVTASCLKLQKSLCLVQQHIMEEFWF